ncbi:MAG: DUF6064 family protein [Bacteroidota bacterium]
MGQSLTLEVLLDVFEQYNLAIWPMQVVGYILGLAALYLIIRKKGFYELWSGLILSFLWLWTGIVYFMLYLGPVYLPACVFGAFFVVQSLFYLLHAFVRRPPHGDTGSINRVVGILFVAYAMVGYPLAGILLGHIYPWAPVFGLTPCPLVVFTFGLFLFSDRKLPWWMLPVPVLWAIGAIVPVSLGILEDIGLMVAGVVGTSLIIYRNRDTAKAGAGSSV